MNPSRVPPLLPILGILGLTVGLLGWLLMEFAGSGPGVEPFVGKNASSLSYLVEPGERLNIDDVRSRSDADWVAWPEQGYVGLRKSTPNMWVKVTLKNTEDRSLNGALECDDFFADRAEAWIQDEAGRWTRLLSGESISTAEKALPGREIAWPVTVRANEDIVVYLRFEDVFGAYVRLVWWPDSTAFHLASRRSGMVEGIYFGGLLALLGYTTLLWLRLRATDLGYYVLYLMTAAAFMFFARAQAPAFGWALGSPGLEAVLMAAMALSGCFLTQFARMFLELNIRFPRLDRWVLRSWSGLLAVVAITALLTPEGPVNWMRWLALAMAATHVGLLALAVAAWRTGAWQARFFMLSFGCLFAGSLPMVAVWFLETTLRDVAMRGLMIGSALEMLMLSLALADRFVRTQRQLVEETEQRRMIEEAYADELEIEVRERTQDLRAANADKDRMLSVIGHDLRGPLTGLMRSADEEDGDFARGAARTGRALLLMIEDLVLWARLRAGTRVVSVHQASAVVVPAVALHHALAEHVGVELVLDVPEDVRVETDLVLAQTLVRNLLANALKFAKNRVVLRAKEDGAGGVHFTVSNDGTPLAAEMAARFAAGEDEPMTATGGLGLRLCREICRAFDMRLGARTSEEGGTEFNFTLKSAVAAISRPMT
jgi:signal transduction histidine kinase